jgi:hypothetical protein
MHQSDPSSSAKGFLSLADIGRSKSSILNQLQWTMAILTAGLIAFQWQHAPSWISILYASLFTADVSVFLVAFVYFMIKRPHSLRSEGFDLQITKLIDKREAQMGAGRYTEVSDLSELEEKGKKGKGPR